MNDGLLYHVQFKENVEVEGRYFFINTDYPVYKKDEKYVILCAENGEFCFHNDLMKKAINEWDLTVLPLT